jgi:RNA polymerase sigma-70 factor (ECF subfamily)
MSQGDLPQQLQTHTRHLWGLCYRMTGCAADADDLVQETFVRALSSPPAREGQLRPWLTRVAMNLSRDLLRARKRQGYRGPWLPSPVPTEEEEAPTLEPLSTEGRYDLLESVSYAFLLALEGLSPTQRAVLILRDVLDAPVEETAATLGLTASNVKTTLHRARGAMAAYEQKRRPLTAERRQRNLGAMVALFEALQRGDHDGMVAALHPEVRGINDGGGVFAAARRPILGAAKLALFLRKIGARRGPPERVELRTFNGLPAIMVTHGASAHPEAPVSVLCCEIDDQGRIEALYTVLAPRKLTAAGAARGRPGP